MRDSDHEIPLRLLTWINMSGIPSLTLLSEKQKFNGNNLLQWNINITQLLGSKGLLGYIDGNIQKPSPESLPLPSETTTQHTSTPIYSTTPTLNEWNLHDQLARGHITLNCIPMWQGCRRVRRGHNRNGKRC